MSINDDTSTTVSYGGTVIARLEAGQTGTVRCARRRMKTDIKIVAGSGGGGTPLTVNARVVDVVTSRINLNLSKEVNAGEVDVVSSSIELKMPIISTNLIVEETE